MHKFAGGNWVDTKSGMSLSVLCWNCGNKVASEKYYSSRDVSYTHHSYIFICPHCNAPIVLDDGKKHVLSSLPGEDIFKLPKNIETVYSEIRKCMQSGSFNGAIILMRKLIMHIAVEEGAPVGQRFEEYVNFLCDNAIVPKKSKGKADSIRTLGNSANHEIENRTPEEAQSCFEFVELLLRANYEFAD